MRPLSLLLGFILLAGIAWQFAGGPIDSAPYIAAEIIFDLYHFFYGISISLGYAGSEIAFQTFFLYVTLLWLLSGIYLILRGLFGSSIRKMVKAQNNNAKANRSR
jgi:ABC-type transport system involved in multi-copper enzyme maturation permease subunit